MALNGLTDRVKTDDGYHFTRFTVSGEAEVLRRDDLRGCWEVNGTVYGSREEAFEAAEQMLDAETQEAPEPDDSSPDLAERVAAGHATA
jgi:hypothetical protein